MDIFLNCSEGQGKAETIDVVEQEGHKEEEGEEEGEEASRDY